MENSTTSGRDMITTTHVPMYMSGGGVEGLLTINSMRSLFILMTNTTSQLSCASCLEYSTKEKGKAGRYLSADWVLTRPTALLAELYTV